MCLIADVSTTAVEIVNPSVLLIVYRNIHSSTLHVNPQIFQLRLSHYHSHSSVWCIHVQPAQHVVGVLSHSIELVHIASL